jgi:hypothetical protein
MALVAQGEYGGIAIANHLAGIVIGVCCLGFIQDNNTQRICMHDQQAPNSIRPAQYAQSPSAPLVFSAQSLETLDSCFGKSNFVQCLK